MAGIGFSLRKMLKNDSIIGTLSAYTVSGIIGGGPWLISVFAIIILSITVSIIPEYQHSISEFQISITYLVAGSLILSGCVGNSFSRYAADQMFVNRSTYVLSNLNGILLILTIVSGSFGLLMVLCFFPQQTILYRLLLMSSFVVLSNIWVVITLLTGLKDYKIILRAFFVSYVFIVLLAYFLRRFGLEAFMLSFLLGQLLLLSKLFIALYRAYPTNSVIAFHFLEKGSLHIILIFTGLFFYLGVWVDKFIFWYSPSTNYPVLGPFRASWFYDLPIFIAYLCTLPGVAAFLLLIETDFADHYQQFNDAIRRGLSYEYIKIQGDKMIGYALNVIDAIIKIQAITIIIIFQFGEQILSLLHIPNLYSHILFLAIIGTSLQLVLLAILSILFYLDRLRDVFILSFLFFVTNLIFTSISIYLGPMYYGLGFTASLMLTCTYGMYLLNEEFADFEYKVIMLRH